MQPSDVIGEAWAIYKAHWRHLIAVAIVVYIAISAIVLSIIAVSVAPSPVLSKGVNTAGGDQERCDQSD